MATATKKRKENSASTHGRPPIGVQLHLVSISEAALILGRSVRTLRYWQAEGIMPARIKVGRRLLYPIDQLYALDRNSR